MERKLELEMELKKKQFEIEEISLKETQLEREM